MLENVLSNISTAIAGISIVINFILVIPKAWKWFWDIRFLKVILESRNRCFLITQALFRPGMLTGAVTADYTLMTEASVISIQKVSRLLQKINMDYRVLDIDKVRYDEIHIGGPISNINVNAYVSQHFSKLYFYDWEKNIERHEKFYNIHRKFIKYSNDFHGFCIEGRTQEFRYSVDAETDYAFLIKLSHEDLKCDKTVHILFGGTDMGILAAVDYFTRNYKELYSYVSKGHYFIVLPVHKTNGMVDTSNLINLTDEMF